MLEIKQPYYTKVKINNADYCDSYQWILSNYVWYFQSKYFKFQRDDKMLIRYRKKKTEQTIFNQERTRMAENGENFFNDNKWLTCMS